MASLRRQLTQRAIVAKRRPPTQGLKTMARQNYLFTSESVSEGHPDKVCDRISDAIVDTFIAAEPQARCGVETLATTNRIVLAGEVRGTRAWHLEGGRLSPTTQEML